MIDLKLFVSSAPNFVYAALYKKAILLMLDSCCVSF